MHIKKILQTSATLFVLGLISCTGDKKLDNSYQDANAPLAISGSFDAGEGHDSMKASCPEGMVLIEGDYCPNAIETCLKWVDLSGKETGKQNLNESGRCGVWEQPTRCASQKIYKKYCIDVYEFPNVRGSIPQSWMTWYDVKNACQKNGKRLCTKSEWTFACEGPEMHPYPYGDGYHRDKSACNFDNEQNVDVTKDTKQRRFLDGWLQPSGLNKKCVSPFGVHDMVGNIDEFVVNESGKPYQSGLVGGHIFGVRNACRPMTPGHNEQFAWYETGGRCCSDSE